MKYINNITPIIRPFEICSPFVTVFLIHIKHKMRVNKKISPNKRIVNLPTLLYGSLFINFLAIASNIIPGETEIIGTIKVTVSNRETPVNIAPIISPLLLFPIFILFFIKLRVCPKLHATFGLGKVLIIASAAFCQTNCYKPLFNSTSFRL